MKNLIVGLAAALVLSLPAFAATPAPVVEEDEFPLALAVDPVTGDCVASVGVTKKGMHFSITNGPDVYFSAEDLDQIKVLIAEMNSHDKKVKQ